MGFIRAHVNTLVYRGAGKKTRRAFGSIKALKEAAFYRIHLAHNI